LLRGIQKTGENGKMVIGMEKEERHFLNPEQRQFATIIAT